MEIRNPKRVRQNGREIRNLKRMLENGIEKIRNRKRMRENDIEILLFGAFARGRTRVRGGGGVTKEKETSIFRLQGH